MKETKIKNVGFEHIAITDGFWKEKQDLFRDVTLDAIYQRFKETGRFEALKCNWKKGMPFEPHIFWESDVTKWIEGAAYFLQKERDAELEARIDALVEDMYHSQEKNGYLNEYFTVVEPEARFTRRTDHELYCAGHLIEGAIAYAEATGKTRLLEVAEKYVALIDWCAYIAIPERRNISHLLLILLKREEEVQGIPAMSLRIRKICSHTFRFGNRKPRKDIV